MNVYNVFFFVKLPDYSGATRWRRGFLMYYYNVLYTERLIVLILFFWLLSMSRKGSLLRKRQEKGLLSILNCWCFHCSLRHCNIAYNVSSSRLTITSVYARGLTMRIRLRYLATCLMVSWIVMTIFYSLPLFLSSNHEEKVVNTIIIIIQKRVDDKRFHMYKCMIAWLGNTH